MTKNIIIQIPLNWQLSKNRKFIGRTKKVLNPAYKMAQEQLQLAAYLECKENEVVFEKRKVFVMIDVYKKNMRGDSLNFQEAVCDALKRAIGVDDNLFSCFCDWHIDKENPRIVIHVTQRED